MSDWLAGRGMLTKMGEEFFSAATHAAEVKAAAEHEYRARMDNAALAGRRRRLHTPVQPFQALLTGVLGPCVCGKPFNNRIHNVAAPAEPPDMSKPKVGEKVRCIDQEDTRYGYVGTVLAVSEHTLYIEVETPDYASPQYFSAQQLQRLRKPPKFTSQEQADRWLEGNA